MSDRDYLRTGFEGEVRNPFWRTHPATKAILVGLLGIHVILVFVKLASTEAWVSVQLALSLRPNAVLDHGYVWQLVTGALLHGDLMHLIWNLLGFWFFGRIVEDRLGVRRYLVFCGAAALAASFAYVAWAVLRSDVVAMVGSSGAVGAIVVLVAFWQPRMTVLVFFILPMPLWVVAAAWVLLDLVQAFEATGDIANMAHLGGALYGFLYHRYAGRFGNVFRAIDRYSEDRQRAKDERREKDEADLRREIDRILDKVNREGMAALTEAERRFLKKAGGRLRS